MKKCFFLFLHESEASSCICLFSKTRQTQSIDTTVALVISEVKSNYVWDQVLTLFLQINGQYNVARVN